MRPGAVTGLTAGLLATALLVGGCRTPAPEEAPAETAANPLFVDPDDRDFSDNPELLERLIGGRHDYFRFVNHRFANEVCRRFEDSLAGTPSFNLHGDAHLEQYAVTDLGRGLTDFDDSASGPAVLDLARLGVSLRLLCRERQMPPERCDGLVREFLDGYRRALEEPSFEAPEPTLVARLRADFSTDRGTFLEWVESVAEPIAQNDGEALARSLAPYFRAMHEQYPDLPPGFFQLAELGRLRLGVGSALDVKYLARVRGPSPDPLDDVILEIKQVRDLTGVDCLTTSQRQDPFRILVGQSRIAYEPYRYLGYVRHQELVFWVHAWVDNYEELDVAETPATPDEIAEIVFDVGVQLGRGHPNQIAAPLDEQLRREQLRLLDRDRRLIESQIRELADQADEAWNQFRAAAESG